MPVASNTQNTFLSGYQFVEENKGEVLKFSDMAIGLEAYAIQSTKNTIGNGKKQPV